MSSQPPSTRPAPSGAYSHSSSPSTTPPHSNNSPAHRIQQQSQQYTFEQSSTASQQAGAHSTTANAAMYSRHESQSSRDLSAHLQSYPCNADGYDVLQEIGVGAFATVYRAVVKDTSDAVAIKVMDLEQFNTNWDEIRREILTMSLLHHANVVRILTSFVDGQDLWIVMPLLKAGSCAALMKQIAPSGFKDEVLIATILREALKGLEYLHKDGRIHRDVKAGNILVGDRGEIQLGDFGVAAALLENGDRQRNRMAPEVMEHTTGYDEKADIWSFGITAMELGYGRAPYARFQPMKVMLLTLQEEPPLCDIYKDDSYKFSKNYHSMLSKCLRKDPKKRPSAKKLLEHKFFKVAQDNQYIYQHLVAHVNLNAAGNAAEHSAERPHVCREKTLIDKAKVEKSKPVSVGSWVFDKSDFEQFKQNHGESIAAERQELGATANAAEAHSSEDEHTDQTAHQTAKHTPLPQSLTGDESADYERQNAELSLQQRIELQKQLEAVEQQVGRFKIQESDQ